MPDLEGKVAVVTGASKGIGRAIAVALCEAGADVAVCSRNADQAAAAAEEIDYGGEGRAMGVEADVREMTDVRRMIEVTVREFGKLDILVANAGIGGGFGSIEEIGPDDWSQVIDTNLTGVYNCCHVAVPEMRKRGSGWIITIGSLAGRYAFAGGTAYNASKFGLIGFSEALMLDVREHGIRVSCVMPGSVDTYFNDTEPMGDTWKLSSEDVAKSVLQLLDYDARALPSRVELRPSRPRPGGR